MAIDKMMLVNLLMESAPYLLAGLNVDRGHNPYIQIALNRGYDPSLIEEEFYGQLRDFDVPGSFLSDKESRSLVPDALELTNLHYKAGFEGKLPNYLDDNFSGRFARDSARVFEHPDILTNKNIAGHYPMVNELIDRGYDKNLMNSALDSNKFTSTYTNPIFGDPDRFPSDRLWREFQSKPATPSTSSFKALSRKFPAAASAEVFQNKNATMKQLAQKLLNKTSEYDDFLPF